jgi:hypothetical protein
MGSSKGGRIGVALPFPSLWFLVIAALASGCSGSLDFFSSAGDQGFLDAGEELIEGDLADQIGLGPLDATCSGQNLQAGDTFSCMARPGQLTPIEFTGTVDDDEASVVITSDNLLLATQVQEVEAFAAGLLQQQTTLAAQPEDFDCGDTSVIIASGEVLNCMVTDPSDGTIYEAPVTIENLQDLAITVNIGNPIG